jgi:hypothetical protein
LSSTTEFLKLIQDFQTKPFINYDGTVSLTMSDISPPNTVPDVHDNECEDAIRDTDDEAFVAACIAAEIRDRLAATDLPPTGHRPPTNGPAIQPHTNFPSTLPTEPYNIES